MSYEKITSFLIAALLIVSCGGVKVLTEEDLQQGEAGSSNSSGLTESDSADAVSDVGKSMLDEFCPEPSDFPGWVVAEKDEEASLEVGQKLYAKNLNGLLRVMPSEDGTIFWTARKRAYASDQAKADAEVVKIKVNSELNADKSKIVVDQPNNLVTHATSVDRLVHGLHYHHGYSHTHTYVDRTHYSDVNVEYQTCLIVKAPPEIVHELKNSSGDLESVGQLANLLTELSSGTTYIDHKGDGDISASSQSGSVDVIKAAAGKIAVEVSSGSVAIDHFSDGDVKLVSSSGTVRVDHKGEGNVEMEASSGDLSLQKEKNGEVNVKTTSGTIDVSGNVYEMLNLESSSGQITYTQLEKGVALKKASSVTTSSGNVRLNWPEDFRASLDIYSNSGDISVPNKYPEPSEVDGDNVLSFSDEVGGLLKIRTSSGDVSINLNKFGGE